MSFDPVSFALGAASAKGGPGGASTLSGLTDVDISNPANGQTLVYNATSGKWENGAGGGGFTIVNGTIDAQRHKYIIPDMTIADFLELAQPVLVHASSVGDEKIIDHYAMTGGIRRSGTNQATITILDIDGSLECSGSMDTPLVFTLPY